MVGNGSKVPNEGQVHLNPRSMSSNRAIKSTFQVAEIARPLMSVSRICDLGMRCIFDKLKADIIDSKGDIVWSFVRDGGLYVAKMKLKKPDHFGGPER